MVTKNNTTTVQVTRNKVVGKNTRRDRKVSKILITSFTENFLDNTFQIDNITVQLPINTNQLKQTVGQSNPIK